MVLHLQRIHLFGLTSISNQTLYEATKANRHPINSLQINGLADINELERMSHNLDRCLDLIRGDKLKEDFARVAPYMIADMLEAGFSGRVTVIQIVKNNLLSGMYKVRAIQIGIDLGQQMAQLKWRYFVRTNYPMLSFQLLDICAKHSIEYLVKRST